MTLVLEVNLNEFKFMKRDSPSFLWAETNQQFVLIKQLEDGTIARCVVNKSFDEDGKSIPEDDELWRSRNLYSLTAKKVLGFTIDGVPMIKPVSITVPDEEKFVGTDVKKEDEEVNDDGSES